MCVENWVAGAVLQLRLRLCGVGVWVNIETCQKKMPRIAIALGFCFFDYYYVLRLSCVTRWEENMWRSSEFVAERWMMKNDSTDRKMDRNECTPEHQLTLERSSIKYIYMRLC